MIILAIESSCDETSVAIVEDGKKVYSNEIFSQIDIHTLYGGVVPEIASRNHIKKITYIIDDALKKANIKQIKIHEFRHSHACLLFQNKIDIEDISYRLGHSSIDITMKVYLKNLPKNEKRVIKLLNSLNC